MAGDILRCQGVSKSFGGIKAVDNLSLSVKEATICGLIGPNGSGKSTLFNLISGAIRRDSGKIFFENHQIDHLAAHKIAQLGLVRTFQTPRLFLGMTVLDNSLLSPKAQRGEDPWNAIFPSRWEKQEVELGKKAKAQLSFLEIDKLYDRPASEISGGQMKLLQLARALMMDPKMLLLDEPTAGVAPRLAQEIFKDIERQRSESGTTFFIIEHRLEILFKYVDYVFVMNRGELIAQGKPDEVVKDPKVVESYLG